MMLRQARSGRGDPGCTPRWRCWSPAEAPARPVRERGICPRRCPPDTPL